MCLRAHAILKNTIPSPALCLCLLLLLEYSLQPKPSPLCGLASWPLLSAWGWHVFRLGEEAAAAVGRPTAAGCR